jgi:hypothetical protein
MRDGECIARRVGLCVGQCFGIPDAACFGHVDRAVHDDPREPGPEGPSRIDPLEGLERLEERVLYGILGVGVVAQDSARERERSWKVRPDEGAKGISIAAAGSLDESALS